MGYSIVMSFGIVILLISGIAFILTGKMAPRPIVVGMKGAYVKTQNIGVVLLFFALLFYLIGLGHGLVPATIFPFP